MTVLTKGDSLDLHFFKPPKIFTLPKNGPKKQCISMQNYYKKKTGKLEKDLDGPFVKKDDQMVNKHIKRSSTLLAIKEMKSKS